MTAIDLTVTSPAFAEGQYSFTLYALDTASLGLNQGASRDQVESSLKPHVLSQTRLMGRFQRRTGTQRP